MPPRHIRNIARSLHVAAAIAIGVYIYSPWGADPVFSAMVLYGAFPAMGASGVWMWRPRLFGGWRGQPRQ